MTKLKNLFLAIIISFFVTTPVFAFTKELDLSLKVYDNADLLTDTQVTLLKRKIDSYVDKYNLDMVLLTTEDNITSPRNYAEMFYDDNDFGIGTNKNGILFLIDKTSGTDSLYLLARGSASDIYTKSKVDSIISEIEQMRNRGYYTMLDTFINSATTVMEDHLKPTEEFARVYDGANLLTSAEKQKLQKAIDEFVKKHNFDMVLVTTATNTLGSVQKYAEDFYDFYNFGIGESRDGVLFLIDRSQGYNDVWMVTTGKAIKYYDDARIDSIIDDVADVKNNGYYAMFDAFVKSADHYASLGPVPTNTSAVEKNPFPWVSSIIISLLVSLIGIGILIYKNKMVRKATKASEYLDKNTINFTRVEDRFISTHTTTTRIPKSNSGSSSGSVGRSGGTTISRGSSGRSHGGGGRRL